MKNSTVSLFESYKQKLPIGQVKLFDWVCSERYKEEAKYIRSLSEKSEQRKCGCIKMKMFERRGPPGGAVHYRERSLVVPCPLTWHRGRSRVFTAKNRCLLCSGGMSIDVPLAA